MTAKTSRGQVHACCEGGCASAPGMLSAMAIGGKLQRSRLHCAKGRSQAGVCEFRLSGLILSGITTLACYTSTSLADKVHCWARTGRLIGSIKQTQRPLIVTASE